MVIKINLKDYKIVSMYMEWIKSLGSLNKIYSLDKVIVVEIDDN